MKRIGIVKACEILGISHNAFYEHLERSDFPKVYKTSPRRIGFNENSIREYAKTLQKRPVRTELVTTYTVDELIEWIKKIPPKQITIVKKRPEPTPGFKKKTPTEKT